MKEACGELEEWERGGKRSGIVDRKQKVTMKIFRHFGHRWCGSRSDPLFLFCKYFFFREGSVSCGLGTIKIKKDFTIDRRK